MKRLADTVLKLAGLLALDGDRTARPKIEAHHFAVAREIGNRWRTSTIQVLEALGCSEFTRNCEAIMESVRQHPDRLVGFCTFSPDSPAGLREAERCLEAGLSGVGEIALYHKGVLEGSSGLLGELVDVCARFNVPLLLHTSEPVVHAYPGKIPFALGALYDLIRQYPAQRFILAHWGGGLFFYALMKKEVREVLRNTWFDTAASPFLYAPEVYRIAGEIVGFEKILFGSDFPLLRPGRYFREMASAGLSQEAMDSIKGKNGACLLGLV